MSSSAPQPTSRNNQPAPGGSGSSPADTKHPAAGWAPYPGANTVESGPRRPPTAVRSALQQIARFAESEHLFRRRRRLLVAVSGGPDSLACLHLLLALRQQFGYELLVAHFDHQLRPQSAADREFVRQHAAALGLEAITGEGPVREVAARQHRGIEETARTMRYQFLAFAAQKENCDAVVTGHTADDQAETVLLHLVRGSGVRGLRGMLPTSPLPGSPGQVVLRPLLPLRRQDTLAVCNALQLQPRSDASNRDPSFLRNRLRAELLPHLQTINPSIEEALVGLAASAREAFALIEHRSYEARPEERGPLGSIFPVAALADLPGEALALVIEREAAFLQREPAINRTRLQNLRAILTRGTGSVTFGPLVVDISAGKARIGPPLEPPDPIPPVLLEVPGSRRAGTWRIDVAATPLQPSPHATVAALGRANLRGALRARPLQPGDRLRWRGYLRKVSDLFVNEKIPIWQRPRTVVIADAEGPVALFVADRAFVRDMPDEPELWIRLAPLPR